VLFKDSCALAPAGIVLQKRPPGHHGGRAPAPDAHGVLLLYYYDDIKKSIRGEAHA